MIREILKVSNLTKVYPGGVVANYNVNIAINEGEIHALIGENGAGKSTLMKMLFGMIPQTSGDIYVSGEKVNFTSSKQALEKGIGMVHQHFMLVPSLSVAENLILGHETSKSGFINIEEAIVQTEEISKKYNYDKIILVPHVVAKTNPGDDDFSYLCEMSKLLKEKGIYVIVAPSDLGFVGVKKYLTQCNVVMSARMHCSINAITCGVPTLFLSYSPKSSGMCEFVYGSSSYVLNMKDCVDGLKFDVLDQFDAAGDDIRLFLGRRNSELCKMANDAMLYLQNQ